MPVSLAELNHVNLLPRGELHWQKNPCWMDVLNTGLRVTSHCRGKARGSVVADTLPVSSLVKNDYFRPQVSVNAKRKEE